MLHFVGFDLVIPFLRHQHILRSRLKMMITGLVVLRLSPKSTPGWSLAKSHEERLHWSPRSHTLRSSRGSSAHTTKCFHTSSYKPWHTEILPVLF